MNERATPLQTRSFSLRLFLLIVFGLSWPFQIASVMWAGGNLLPTYVLNISSMIMVTVGTYIAGRYVFRDGFAGALEAWPWPPCITRHTAGFAIRFRRRLGWVR
jgi:uncharacterized protein